MTGIYLHNLYKMTLNTPINYPIVEISEERTEMDSSQQRRYDKYAK